MTERIMQALVTAYNAMETTKQRHLMVLEAMDRRNKRYGLPSSDVEEALLQRLLDDHNTAVNVFKAASSAAREISAPQLGEALADLTQLDQALQPYRE